MEEYFAAAERAFEQYEKDLKEYERKRRPTDGLLGFGRSLKDDICHERLDDSIRQAVEGLCAASPSPEDAERMVRLLLSPGGTQAWPEAAKWMLRAIERHTLPLIPFLSKEAAAAFFKQYAARYKPWDRLPAQQKVYKALRERA